MALGVVRSTTTLQPSIARPLSVQPLNGRQQPTAAGLKPAVIATTGLQPVAAYRRRQGQA